MGYEFMVLFSVRILEYYGVRILGCFVKRVVLCWFVGLDCG